MVAFGSVYCFGWDRPGGGTRSQGGGLYLSGSSSATVTSSTISGNYVVSMRAVRDHRNSILGRSCSVFVLLGLTVGDIWFCVLFLGGLVTWAWMGVGSM